MILLLKHYFTIDFSRSFHAIFHAHFTLRYHAGFTLVFHFIFRWFSTSSMITNLTAP